MAGTNPVSNVKVPKNTGFYDYVKKAAKATAIGYPIGAVAIFGAKATNYVKDNPDKVKDYATKAAKCTVLGGVGSLLYNYFNKDK